MRSDVGVVEGFFGIPRPAIMDLHDDGRFVLVRINPSTKTFGEKIFDCPVMNLSVGGASTYLTLSANGTKKRVDFSTRSAVGFGALGIVGYAIASSYATDAGLKNWVAMFRQNGLLRHYSNTSRNLIVLGSILGGLVILVVGLAVLARAFAP